MRELWQANNNGWSADIARDGVVDKSTDGVLDTARVVDRATDRV